MDDELNLVVLWLFNETGSEILTGGLERWCRDVALLAAGHGRKVTIYQKASVAFDQPFARGVRVVGVPCSLAFRGNWTLSKWILRNCDPSAPYLYVSQEIAIAGCFPRSVAVNHGIWWNGDMPRMKLRVNKTLQRRSLATMRAIICVDTNYINWCHAELAGRERWQHKLLYVPNYADLDQFGVETARHTRGSELTILFARRVSGKSLERQSRGAGFFLKAVEILEERGVRTRLLFAGRGELQEAIERWANDHGMTDRVEVFESNLDDMGNHYRRCDVVVVPSIEHEGTSLSAIEGIVAGLPTVVSHIGGLCNIVIPGLNGLVADLAPDSLADAILQAARSRPLDEPALLAACRRALGKERWERDVWSHLTKALVLDRGAHTTGAAASRA